MSARQPSGARPSAAPRDARAPTHALAVRRTRDARVGTRPRGAATGAVVRAQMGHAAARMTDHDDTAWLPEQQAMVRGAFTAVLPDPGSGVESGDARWGRDPGNTKAG